MTSFDPRLITPPKEEEEIYPYRRVWVSIAIESGLLFSLVVILYVLGNIVDVRFPRRAEAGIGIAIALTPATLWLIVSWGREQLVLQPRQHLMTVFIVSALAARAVGTPLVDSFFEVDRWLPTADSISRILGYTFTVGIVQDILIYLVLRYLVWPQFYRIRLDSVAFGAASAIGYATTLNLQAVGATQPPPDLAAIRVFNITAVLVATSIIIAYGLAELRFSQPFILLPTVTVGLAALITGFVLPFRTGLTNAILSLRISTPNPILGVFFSAVVLILVAATFIFLFNVAERTDRDIVGEPDA